MLSIITSWLPMNYTSLACIFTWILQHKNTPESIFKHLDLFTLFFFFNIYLFIILAAPGLSCGTRDLHCGLWDL